MLPVTGSQECPKICGRSDCYAEAAHKSNPVQAATEVPQRTNTGFKKIWYMYSRFLIFTF